MVKTRLRSEWRHPKRKLDIISKIHIETPVSSKFPSFTAVGSYISLKDGPRIDPFHLCELSRRRCDLVPGPTAPHAGTIRRKKIIDQRPPQGSLTESPFARRQCDIERGRNIPASFADGFVQQNPGFTGAGVRHFENDVGAAVFPGRPRRPGPDGKRKIPGQDFDEPLTQTFERRGIDSRIGDGLAGLEEAGGEFG